MRTLGAVALAMLMLLFIPTAHASVFEPRTFASQAEALRYKTLIDELRCLVCQNQNIAASDADLARDLRDRVYTMISAGRSDEEIIEYMVTRYGDFVLYRPPLSRVTVALWAGPFILGVLALAFLFTKLGRIRRQGAASQTPLSNAERKRAHVLLDADAVPRASADEPS